MIPKNEGPIDRAIRIVVGIVVLAVGLFAMDGLEGAGGGLLVAGLSLLPFATGISGRCPLYVPFGISTLHPKEAVSKTHRPVASH